MQGSPRDAPGTVLCRLGLDATRLRLVARRHDAHWIGAGRGSKVVLRRCAPGRSLAELAYELRLLEHLRARGWPVAAPLAAPLELEGAVWCAFSHLPGRARAPRSEAGTRVEQRERGRLLATLHADLGELSALGQRPGWRRADQGLHERPGRPDAESVLHAHALRAPEESRLLLAHLSRTRAQLGELLPRAPAPIVIHGDFAPWNLRYQRSVLSGILDFELAHLDLRVADFALAWRGQYDEVVRGYEEVAPLEPVERELIVPVYRAWLIASAVAGIDAGETTAAWSIQHLLRTPLL